MSAVFVGIVHQVDGGYPIPDKPVDDQTKWQATYLEGGRSFRMEILGAWKGATHRSVIVQTGHGGGDCGFEFVVGDVYIIYARNLRTGSSADTVTTDLCTRTGRWIDSERDSADLGKLITDFSGGRSWDNWAPASHCPLHTESKVRLDYTTNVFQLPRGVERDYWKIQDRQFPYAGLQIDRPPPETHDEKGELFRDISRAFVCPECRKLALDWCYKHGARRPSE